MTSKEAIERIKTRFDKWALDNEDMKAIQTLIPELAESEDERIRKELIDFFMVWKRTKNSLLGTSDWRGINTDRIITWLEKQKEQMPSISCVHENDKPAEWSEEDIKKIRSEEYTKGFNDAAFGGKLKEWSEEDEDRIRQIERIAQQVGCTQKLQEEIHDWLKSLRPQYHRDVTMTEAYKMGLEAGRASSWKPSEEQMKALEAAFRKEGNDEYRRTINSLYQDLKKLCEKE